MAASTSPTSELYRLMVVFGRITPALTGPPPINIDLRNDANGGSASNALFCHHTRQISYPIEVASLMSNGSTCSAWPSYTYSISTGSFGIT
jgi:hypothetical protein